MIMKKFQRVQAVQAQKYRIRGEPKAELRVENLIDGGTRYEHFPYNFTNLHFCLKAAFLHIIDWS